MLYAQICTYAHNVLEEEQLNDLEHIIKEFHLEVKGRFDSKVVVIIAITKNA